MMSKKTTVLNALTLCYFVITFFEVLAEYFVSNLIIYILKPLLPLFLILFYCIESDKKDKLFIAALLLSSVTNLLFIPDTSAFLFYGVMVFTVHRLIVIYLILLHQKVKDYIPTIIATAPFLLIFFYFFSETIEIPEDSIYILIFQNLLISIFAGIALSSYVMNDNKQNSILLISALLFVMLQFVVFIEKYFLINEFQELFRPLAMTLNALAFFSFYKYLVTAEKSYND